MRHIKQIVIAVTALVALGGLSACGSLSHNIASDGRSAGELAWPAHNDVTPMHKGGTWPALATLRRIRPGMNKHQLSNLIGAPHFSEGAWGVHEWNYLFHLLPADGGAPVTCQYKVLFDHDYQAQSFYWQPASCVDLLVKATQEETPEPVAFTLSADALFNFDSAQLGHAGHQALDALARKINQRQGSVQAVRIIGHTDRLGSKTYNGLLSRQRAHAVSRYLQDQGVAGNLLTAVGLGEGHPVKTDCGEGLSHANLIACLAPNRRVEVQVFGQR